MTSTLTRTTAAISRDIVRPTGRRHRAATAGIAAHGVPAGHASDLAHAGFRGHDITGWAAAVSVLGVNEAGWFRELGYSPEAAVEASAAGVNAWALLAVTGGR